jgi:hypothetical protein
VNCTYSCMGDESKTSKWLINYNKYELHRSISNPTAKEQDTIEWTKDEIEQELSTQKPDLGPTLHEQVLIPTAQELPSIPTTQQIKPSINSTYSYLILVQRNKIQLNRTKIK